jgi:dTMP kinase
MGMGMKLDKGYLIALEGVDGTGKSTQCALLADYLESAGYPVVRLREPTQGVWGQKIRKILTEGRGDVTPEEELQYFINDRKEDVELNIAPALEQGKIVLIDRYYYSTAAYQGALGFDPVKIIEDNEAFAPRPDLLLIIEVSLDESFRRIEEGRDEISSFEKRDYLEKVRVIFDTFIGKHIRRIDSTPPKDEVQALLQQEVNALLGLKETS